MIAITSFKVLQFRRVDNLKVLEVGAGVPFARQDLCPADEQPLRTLCTLVGARGAQRIRLGCCDRCGYTGYIDRPTRAWLDAFYADTWAGYDMATEALVGRMRERIRLKSGRRTAATTLEQRLQDVATDRAICEVGSGYGFTLERLKQLGFAKCVGIEASRQRAEVARRAFGVEVLSSPFEDSTTQRTLGGMAPFALMFSHHVLEHTYDPAEIIRTCASLQEPGDYLVLSLPNAIGELPLMTALYLPHLHAFTLPALTAMLARFGYGVIDDSATDRTELYVVARKGAPRRENGDAGGHFARTRDRFVQYFGLDRWSAARRRLFCAFRKVDVGGSFPVWTDHPRAFRLAEIVGLRLAPHLYRRAIVERLGAGAPTHRKIMTVAIEVTRERSTATEASPLEIQFDGPIRLLSK